MRRLLRVLALTAALGAAGGAFAQSSFPTQTPNINAPGTVDMCRDTHGTAVPCSELTPLSVKVMSGIPTAEYPPGAIPISCIATGTTSAVVATCAAAPGRTTWLCGFDVSAIGGTAAVGPITVANLNGGTFTYQASSSAAGIIISRDFRRCIPAATLNTAITITTTADGTASAVDINGYGYQL